jgi:hypothetical protein
MFGRGLSQTVFALHDYKTTTRANSSTTNRYISVKCCSQVANAAIGAAGNRSSTPPIEQNISKGMRREAFSGCLKTPRVTRLVIPSGVEESAFERGNGKADFSLHSK